VKAAAPAPPAKRRSTSTLLDPGRRCQTRLPDEPRTADSAAWFAVTAGVLSGVAPLLIIGSTPLDEASSSVWPWAWLLTVLVGLRYAWLVASGSRRLYELIFWLFTYVFLGLAPLAQMRTAHYAGTTPDLDPRLNGRVLLVVGVACVAFALGVVVAGQRPLPAAGADRPGVVMHRLLLLTALALAVTAYYVSKIGIPVLFSNRAQRTAAEAALWPDGTVQAIVKAAATLPLVVSFVALIRLRNQRHQAGAKGPAALVCLVLVALFVVVNPITSPRYVFGTAVLALCAALGVTSTPQRTRVFALVLAAGLVLVFPYADLTRRANTATELSLGPAQSLSSSDFDAFDQLNNIVALVRDEGTVGGHQLAGAALFWVPRSVWSAKPRDTGIVVAEYRGYRFQNLSAPLVGEFFLNGGWVLLGAGMALLGFAVRRLDQGLLASKLRAPGQGVLASVLPFYLVLVLRGSLLQSMAGLTVLVGCAAIISSRRTPAEVPLRH